MSRWAGLGEIGMNCAHYGFGGARKKWIMVDLGVSFGGPDSPGIDLIMPDLRFIEAERKASSATSSPMRMRIISVPSPSFGRNWSVRSI